MRAAEYEKDIFKKIQGKSYSIRQDLGNVSVLWPCMWGLQHDCMVSIFLMQQWETNDVFTSILVRAIALC